MLVGDERRRLLAVGCGSLAAGASIVALITFATDRCHVCYTVPDDDDNDPSSRQPRRNRNRKQSPPSFRRLTRAR